MKRAENLLLVEISRRKPILKNRVAPEVEEAVVKMAFDYPAYGQARACNELRKHGIFISAAGVRCVWQRHDLEVFDKRLKALETRMAQEGLILTEAQMMALERKREKEKLLEKSRLNIQAIWAESSKSRDWRASKAPTRCSRRPDRF